MVFHGFLDNGSAPKLQWRPLNKCAAKSAKGGITSQKLLFGCIAVIEILDYIEVA